MGPVVFEFCKFFFKGNYAFELLFAVATQTSFIVSNQIQICKTILIPLVSLMQLSYFFILLFYLDHLLIQQFVQARTPILPDQQFGRLPHLLLHILNLLRHLSFRLLIATRVHILHIKYLVQNRLHIFDYAPLHLILELFLRVNRLMILAHWRAHKMTITFSVVVVAVIVVVIIAVPEG